MRHNFRHNTLDCGAAKNKRIKNIKTGLCNCRQATYTTQKHKSVITCIISLASTLDKKRSVLIMTVKEQVRMQQVNIWDMLRRM